jgi:hypothetical protein
MTFFEKIGLSSQDSPDHWGSAQSLVCRFAKVVSDLNREATVQLLASRRQGARVRSGIYIRSGNDEQDKLSPKRGSS